MDFKPLEFSDFSGGMTENILQADPRRYEKADNFFITVDKKLLERPALIPFGKDSFYLPADISKNTNRVNIFLSVINESILLPGSGRNIYSFNEVTSKWDNIVGIGGNPVLQGGNSYSQVQDAEFQHVIYLTSDGLENSQGIQPSKLFRNDLNVWTARTVGLPRVLTNGQTDQDLISASINLANDLRDKFILHLSDAQNPNYITPTYGQTIGSVNLHINIDKYALSYLVAQTFTVGVDPQIPSPIPTPAPAATDEATLYTLVEALNKAYASHNQDAIKNSAQQPQIQQGLQSSLAFYHQDIRINQGGGPNNIYRPYKGPFAALSANAKPTEIESAAMMLNDLYDKYSWHRKAVWGHSYNNSPAQYDKYGVISNKIDLNFVGKVPAKLTEDWGDVLAYANNLRFLYKAHTENIDAIGTGVVGAKYGHKVRDNFSTNMGMGLECTMPEVTNIVDAYNLIYWLRALYSAHTLDALTPSYLAVQATLTPGSSALTLVKDLSGNNIDILASLAAVRAKIWFRIAALTDATAVISNQYDPNNKYMCAYITASGSGTATMDRAAIGSGNQLAQATVSFYHGFGTGFTDANPVGSTMATSSVSAEVTGAALGTAPFITGTSPTSWLQLANEFFTSFASHVQNPLTHAVHNPNGQPNFIQWMWQSYISRVPYGPFFPAQVGNFAYAFHWKDEYTVETNGIDYLTVSDPTFTTSFEVPKFYPLGSTVTSPTPTLYPDFTITTSRANVLSELPVIVNDTNTNYAVANIKLAIYRTSDGGNTYYLEDEVANGTTTYADYLNDTISALDGDILIDGEVLYTNGGVVGFAQPPICKYIHNFEGKMFYGALIDSDQYFPNRILQSVPNAPDGAPGNFTYDLSDELRGLSSSRSNLIALCKNSLYRISGGFNLQGQGALTAETISDVMGCLNANSIVKTEIGVFFAGTDGFYYTDGFQIIKISIDLDKTYAKLTESDSQKRNIVGSYDKLGRRILWSMKTSATDSDNSITFVYHVDYGVKPSGVFTTMSNGLNYRPSSMVHQDGVMYTGHGKGAILKSYAEGKADVNVSYLMTNGVHATGLFRTLHIPYWFKSVAVDMGTTFNRKWLTKLHLIGQNHGDMLVQSYALRDLNQTQQGAKAMAPINYNHNTVWGNPICIWGDPAEKWEYDGKMDVWRRFPKNTLRSDFMQIEIIPYRGVVYSLSQNYPESATASVTANSAVIVTTAPYTNIIWPLDVVGMFFKSNLDEYQNEYEIINATGNTISFDGSVNFTPVSGLQWEIHGYKKEQRVSLSSFLIHFTYLGDENQSYPGASTGSGPGNTGGNPR